MKNLASALIWISGLAFVQAGVASEPSARELHAAACVAALDTDTQALAQRVRSGTETARALLFDHLVAGAAFVGDTYLHGESDESRARVLANEAREAQKALPAPELAEVQAACADEGAKLFSSGNGLQRAVVKHLAKKRMDKLLGA